MAIEDPPGQRVDHNGERYTLDGKAVSRQRAEQGQACVASPDDEGVVACFTTESDLSRTSAARLRAGQLPLGYGAMPPDISRKELAARFDRDAASGVPARPPSAARANAVKTAPSKKPSRRPTYRRHDGYNCAIGPVTRIWIHSNYNGTVGEMGYTGNTFWRNYSATFDNAVSSFWAATSWTTRWHDYQDGNGAYYGNGFPCRFVENLQNGNMTDGGTANDRFTSWIIY